MSSTNGAPLARLEAVLRGAADLAGAWGGRARGSTSSAQERAVLRLFGVSGLDRSGVPLASAVVERLAAGGRDRLAAGVALPFAVALGEYDLTPQQLALDVASGAVDLAFESELLAEPERRATAEAEARRLAALALERIGANRVARLELIDLLGDAPSTWLGFSLAAPMLPGALDETARLLELGANLVRIRVPALRELVLQLHGHRGEPGSWQPRTGGPSPDQEEQAAIPAGSQRALAALRARADQVAAETGRYARLGSVASALAAPEQALVAGLERIDIVEADPVAEIVRDGVDPDRALADHAFGHRLLHRAGAMVLLGPGPLVVAPDLARGQPADAPTRAGRAFAMQALAIALARGDGLPASQLAAGAFVPWLADEREAAAHALAAVAIRRIAWPDVVLAFEEPELSGPAAALWPYLVALGLGLAGRESLVLPSAGDQAARGRAVQATRAAASLATQIADSPANLLHRPSVAHQVEVILTAAEETLARLADEGWRSVVGEPLGGPGTDRLGATAVVERTDPFDPLASTPRR